MTKVEVEIVEIISDSKFIGKVHVTDEFEAKQEFEINSRILPDKPLKVGDKILCNYWGTRVGKITQWYKI